VRSIPKGSSFFLGGEQRAAEGARGEARPQPISIGDADDAVHLLLALTSGEAREAAALVHHHPSHALE